MMTAGQIADRLGVKEVTINYRASEISDLNFLYKWKQMIASFDENPMLYLEYAKYGFNFKRM